MNIYTRKKMLGRKVAIAGKPASTGIGIPPGLREEPFFAVDCCRCACLKVSSGMPISP